MAGVVTFWLIFAFIVAQMGASKKIGFLVALLISLAFSPLIGLIVVLVSEKEEVKLPPPIPSAHTTTTPERNASTGISEELHKLTELRDKGALSEDEFSQAKAKILNK